VLHWRPSSGIQSPPPKYRWGTKTVNAGWVTTFNEQAVVSENRLTKIPDDFDIRIAPLFGCAVTTAFGVVNNDASIKVGQSLIVFGLGGVGLNIIQAASMVSANPIIGVDIKDNKIEMAKKFGLNYGINALNNEVKDQVNEILEDKCADIVIETTGNSRVIEMAYELTKPDGKTILVGVPKKGDNISIYSLPLHFKKILKGSEGGDSVPDQDIPRLIKLMQAKKMTLDGLITHEFPLEEINQAIELFRKGDAGRIILRMN
jgi:S-(hydroxymethyl)glutathione dehydrogenase/alcohol dehydrogenase